MKRLWITSLSLSRHFHAREDQNFGTQEKVSVVVLVVVAAVGVAAGGGVVVAAVILRWWKVKIMLTKIVN